MTQVAQHLINAFATADRIEPFQLADFLARMASLIGSRDVFEEAEDGKHKNEEHTGFIFRNKGPYGALTITVAPYDRVVYVKYRSGAEITRSDRFNINDVQHFESFMRTFKARVDIARVWHRGAIAIAEDLLATVPTNAFRHEVVRRPSYEKSYPFCDFVLKDFPDTCMLRVAHDGFSLWQDGKFQRVEKWSDIDTRPITQVLEGEVRSMWRLGTGILFTTGQFERTETGIKFTPSKRG